MSLPASPALLPRRSWEVVQHQCTEDDIERSVTEGKLLDNRGLESYVDISLRGLLLRPLDHFGRSVDADYRSSVADAFLRSDGKRTGSAADVQYGFSKLEMREVSEPLAQRALTPV